MAEPVILGHDRGETLADQEDVTIWKKLQILLQGVAELTAEKGEAGDATRQLRLVVAEAIKRDMFGISVRKREPTDDLLWTWYEILKQFIEGVNAKKWDAVEGSEKQYREVVLALKERGHEMPKQEVRLEPLNLAGKLVKPQ